MLARRGGCVDEQHYCRLLVAGRRSGAIAMGFWIHSVCLKYNYFRRPDTMFRRPIAEIDAHLPSSYVWHSGGAQRRCQQQLAMTEH